MSNSISCAVAVVRTNTWEHPHASCAIWARHFWESTNQLVVGSPVTCCLLCWLVRHIVTKAYKWTDDNYEIVFAEKNQQLNSETSYVYKYVYHVVYLWTWFACDICVVVMFRTVSGYSIKFDVWFSAHLLLFSFRFHYFAYDMWQLFDICRYYVMKSVVTAVNYCAQIVIYVMLIWSVMKLSQWILFTKVLRCGQINAKVFDRVCTEQNIKLIRRSDQFDITSLL